jgi:hypothetical protein
LRAEVLDRAGHVIPPFTRTASTVVRGDSTRTCVSWADAGDLARVSGQPVRFRFHLTSGSLYAFWVSASDRGASRGYVAAGGPGFTSPADNG